MHNAIYFHLSFVASHGLMHKSINLVFTGIIIMRHKLFSRSQ